LLDGDRLLTLGRLGDGTLALARFRAADLTLLGVDTLSGYAWDGMLPLQRSPRLAAGNGAYYAVHGNDPSTRGPILRLDRETGKVIVEQESPESRLGELVRIGDRIYASSPSPDSRLLLGFDADLFPVDTVKVGMPIARLAADSAGAFAGYGFAAAGDKALAFVPGGKAVLGALPIPTTGEARWIAVDGRTRTVLISDGAILYAAVFRPD
jgi:hypothetical protein